MTRTQRLHPEPAHLAALDDTSRLISSGAWRRLGDITQVDAGPGDENTSVRRTRLTHSLEVAQLGAQLASRLQQQRPDGTVIDPNVVFAAGLAHDLGHPPFGHVGEDQLNTLCLSVGGSGFEGNAQTLRSVARHDSLIPGGGLNLTRATIRACLKYPWGPHDPRANGKYSVYPEDSDLLTFALGDTDPHRAAPSPEAQIMDCADDITYAVHDLTDYVSSGHVSLNALIRHSPEELIWQLWPQPQSTPELISAAQTLISTLEPMARSAAQGTSLEMDATALRHSLSERVGWRGNTIGFDPQTLLTLVLLKRMIWTYVIDAHSTGIRQHGARNVTQVLFEQFHRAARTRERRIFPPELLRSFDACAGRRGPQFEAAQARLSCDAVARLSERGAQHLTRTFRGFN